MCVAMCACSRLVLLRGPQLSNSQGGGGVGYASATWTAHAEWSYMGTFSACVSNLYYNIA